MSNQPLNRREFLEGLIALGARWSLAARARLAAVDQTWLRATESPWTFIVNESGTILNPSAKEPEVWADVLDVPRGEILRRPQDVVDEALLCELLRERFRELAPDALADLESELEELPAGPHRRSLQRLVRAMSEDEDGGWQQWVLVIGRVDLQPFRDIVDEFLDEPIDWMQSEWIPVWNTPQGQAMQFFEDLEPAIRRALGIAIIEGEHPGSTYFAAELRQTVEQTNRAAMELGLPIRFEAMGSGQGGIK